MSLPKLRPIVGDRRDVRASQQFAEQNLLKQKSFIEADLKKRQVELQRNERILKKTFGNLAKTSTTNLGVVQTNQKDIRGGHGAADESNKNVKFNRDHDALTARANRRLGRRHSLHSDTLTPELSRLGIEPSAPNRAAGRKHGRRGSVDANIPASVVIGRPSIGVETNQIDERSLTKQTDGGQIIEDNSDMFSKNTNENLIRDSRERNAVFVFKYEEDDSKVQKEQPKVQSCFAVDKPQETNRESGGIQPGKPKSALSRSRSQRKKLRVQIMSPVLEHNQSVPTAESDGQLDSGISEESENSSCGTRSLYSDSYDSLSHASESDWCQEEAPLNNTSHRGSHQGKLSIDVNSNNLLKPLKKNRGVAASETFQSLNRVKNHSLALRASDPAQFSGETLGPPKASLTRRRRSIAAAEGISLYQQEQTHCPTKRYSDTTLPDDTELSPLRFKPSDFHGRRGSTSNVGESLARDTGEVRPTLFTSGRQEGARQPLPSSTKVKVHHKPKAGSNNYVQKTIERAAAWEVVRRSRYLPGYESNAAL